MSQMKITIKMTLKTLKIYLIWIRFHPQHQLLILWMNQLNKVYSQISSTRKNLRLYNSVSLYSLFLIADNISRKHFINYWRHGICGNWNNDEKSNSVRRFQWRSRSIGNEKLRYDQVQLSFKISKMFHEFKDWINIFETMHTVFDSRYEYT